MNDNLVNSIKDSATTPSATSGRSVASPTTSTTKEESSPNGNNNNNNNNSSSSNNNSINNNKRTRSSILESRSEKNNNNNNGNGDDVHSTSTLSTQHSTTHQHHNQPKRKKRRKYISSIDSDRRKGNRCMNDLVQGVLIYAFCVGAPVIFGIIVKWYGQYFVTEDSSSGGSSINSSSISGGETVSGRNTVATASTLGSSNSFFTTTSPTDHSTPATSTIPSLFSLHTIYKITSKLLLSSSTFLSSYSVDVQYIIIFTIIQSIIRVIIVHLLVPRYFVPQRFAAFVRNKSSHLLSSSVYEWSKNNHNDGDSDSKDHKSSSSTSLLGANMGKEAITQYMSDAWVSTAHSIRRSLGHETTPTRRITPRSSLSPSTEINAGIPALPSLSPTNSNPTTMTSTKILSRDDDNDVNNNSNNIDSTDIFAAPRMATAIFRLLCCTFSCFWALKHFRTASFWPVWVGGSVHGSTKYCWDLSGTVDPQIFVMKHPRQRQEFDNNLYPNSFNSFGVSGITGASEQTKTNTDSMDVDFDNQNSALRYFFLGQASYQLQSLCFHILSMLLLLIYGGINKGNKNEDSQNNKEDFIISARSSFKSYMRPVVEHSLYFILTISTFFFSALRRLGSICIFALEVSSLSVQLLQICINAPESSKLRNPHVIKFVHKYLAIPIFVYARFFVLPFIVQYSSAFESSNWLRQIDHAFIPGCGRIIYAFFNGTLLFAFGLNFVYLRRLIFHPHVNDISSKTIQ